MPRYDQYVSFLGDVRRANAGFTKSRSSLSNLIDLLTNAASTVGQVTAAINALPQAKKEKYRDALWYLMATYPGFAAINLPVGNHAQGKTNAISYKKRNLAADYAPPGIRNKPFYRWLNMTPEQWLLNTAGPVGVIIIHLSNFQAEMNTEFNGRRSVDHMNSVLRMARLNGADLLCLHMNGNPVCDELREAADAYDNRKTDVLVAHHHMGGHSQVFRNFANNYSHVIVMGFDADVCVNANLFGADEHFPAAAGGGLVPPLSSMTDIVTSRALLVTRGQIYPVNNKGEYGGLNGT